MGFLAYQNADLAKRKGLNTVKWVVYTILACIVFYLLGGSFLVTLLYNGPADQAAIQEFVLGRPLIIITSIVMGIGGYVFTRYRLDKKPDLEEDDEE